MKKFMSFLLLVLLITPLWGQSEGEIVSVQFLSSVNVHQAGQTYPVAFKVDIRSPFHINSPNPTEDFLIPSTLQLDLPEGVTIDQIKFPKAEIKTLEFSETPLAIYENTIFIHANLTISETQSPGEVTFNGTFGYQACDNQTCRAPADVIFQGKFSVAAAGAEIQAANIEVFSQKSETTEMSAPAGDDSFADTVQEKGLFLTFILVFLGGLALNLTPCVYPLIPITISYFGGQAKGSRGSVISHAIIYVLGMAITYSVLGVIAALTGSMFGAALQNPMVLIAIAAILVGLAFSMFDLYEIRVPSFLSNFAGGAKQGYFGTFFMGLTVGIVAAPCIGPFVLALLTYVGEKGSVLLGFWLFFVLALGLGVPFLFLGIFSGSMNKIPRSGAWMIWVRSIFGFILFAMAVYFLAPLFPNGLYYSLTMALIFLVGGIYMAWIDPTTSPGKAFPIIRNIIGVIFFALSLFVAVQGIQGYVDSEIEQLSLKGGVENTGIHWENYSEDQLNEAMAKGQPVMMDFYADWCIPCKELEKFTFSKEPVIQLSRNFKMLKVNLTKTGDPTVIAIKKRFKIMGVPTLIFLGADGVEVPGKRVVGFMDVKDFMPVMQSALDASK